MPDNRVILGIAVLMYALALAVSHVLTEEDNPLLPHYSTSLLIFNELSRGSRLLPSGKAGLMVSSMTSKQRPT